MEVVTMIILWSTTQLPLRVLLHASANRCVCLNADILYFLFGGIAVRPETIAMHNKVQIPILTLLLFPKPDNILPELLMHF